MPRSRVLSGDLAFTEAGKYVGFVSFGRLHQARHRAPALGGRANHCQPGIPVSAIALHPSGFCHALHQFRERGLLGQYLARKVANGHAVAIGKCG